MVVEDGWVDIETNSKLVSHQSPQLLTHTQTQKTLEKYFSLLYKLGATHNRKGLRVESGAATSGWRGRIQYYCFQDQ